MTEYNGVVGQLQHDLFESRRQHAYAVALPANDPGYRMVRDSRRLELAQQLEQASRLAYLAARRAEYEYTARLSGSNFRISDIYKARTANDILIFLQGLETTIANLPGAVKDAEINQTDLTISVARHLLGLSDAFVKSVRKDGETTKEARLRLFRRWVADHTTVVKGKARLTFDFSLVAAADGNLNQIVQEGYSNFWLHKVAGNRKPMPKNTGLGINLLSAQTKELGYRRVSVSQSGQVVLTSFAGCQFDYRLIPPALLLGLDYPTNQPTDLVTGDFQASINGQPGNKEPGYSTPTFLGRPLASNGWQVTILAGSPDGKLPEMDLQKLTDIELKISTTYATRVNNTPPQASECVRVDY